MAGRLSGTNRARDLTRQLKLIQPRWIWLKVVSKHDRYVIVHLIDGSVIYGYPSEFTDDSREETREMLLTYPHFLVKDPDGGADTWESYPNTEAVLIESSQVKLIQLLTPDRST